MALSASTVWEVRTTGSDTNGGGFVTGASGTDWSQQNSAQYAVTDGVTAGTTTITSATAAFGTGVVGNIIYVSGGTGSITAGRYQIVSRTNSTTIVVDRSTGLTTGTGVTLNIGGALATIGTALALMTQVPMTAYVKATGTYSLAATLSTPTQIGNAGELRLIGYTTTRGDNGQATVQQTASSTALITSASGSFAEQNAFVWWNFVLDANSKGALLTGSSTIQHCFWNCVLKNASTSTSCIAITGDLTIENCDITGNTASTSGGIIGGTADSSIVVIGCTLHGNTCSSTRMGVITTSQQGDDDGAAVILSNIIYDNSGANTKGVVLNGYRAVVMNNTIHNSGSDGIYLSGQYNNAIPAGVIKNNIITSNGGYGLNATNIFGTTTALSVVNNNAYYGNTSGSYNLISAGPSDISLAALPYISASTNFALNSNSGQGASCRNIGYPSPVSSSNNLGSNFADIGALRHQDQGLAS